MAFTKLTKDMNIIQKLEDEPNDVGGMTSAQLKAKFDEPGNAVKDWINNTFIPQAEQELSNALLGQLPDGTVTAEKLKDGVLSNPNLLDNWYFPDPVNQKGQSEYTHTAAGYTVDRWVVLNGGITVDGDGITFTASGASTCQFYQKIEQGRIESGKTYTLSFLTKSGQLVSGSSTVPDTTGSNINYAYCTADGVTWHLVFGRMSGVPFFALRDQSGTAHTIQLTAAKLELGPVQTLAHRDESGAWVLNDPPPDKGTELAKCQRYQIIGNMLGSVVMYKADFLGVFVPTPVTVRAVPSMVGTWSVKDHTGAEQSGFAVNSILLRKNGFYLSLKKSAHGLTGGYLAFDTDGGFDANL